MQFDAVQLSAALLWLALVTFLLVVSYYLFASGRRFEIRARISFSGGGSGVGFAVELSFALCTAAILGAALFTVAPGSPRPMRIALAAAGATAYLAAAWWVFAWMRETAALRAVESAQTCRRLRAAALKIRTLVDRNLIRVELCSQVGDAFNTPRVDCYVFRDNDWRCAASLVNSQIGQPWPWPAIVASNLSPSRSHRASGSSAPLLVPVAISYSETEWLAVSSPHSSGRFTHAERAYAEALASEAAAALATLDLAARSVQRVHSTVSAQADRELVRRALSRLIPPDLPEIAGLDYAAEYWRGASPQGLFLDIVALPKSSLGLVLAEIDSAGIEAAVQMAQLQILLRSRFQAYAEDLAELLESTERALLSVGGRPAPVRLFCARYAQAERVVHYVNAGYLPPFLLRRRADGTEALRLSGAGSPLAAAAPTRFETAEMPLLAGDVFAMPGMSLLHVASADGESFGENRFIDTLLTWHSQRASELVRLILRSVEEHSGPAPDAADRALAILKPLPPTEDA